jgi:FKBP-type peptidyl-prolyl cis-trans isomerase FkpA
MTRKRDRAFALFGAILFFVTTIALTVSIVYQMTRGNSGTSNTANTSNSTNKKEGKNMLAGTKLENFEPGAAIPELKTEDTKVGTGDEAKAGDTVVVDYTGALAKTGVIFESSKDSGQPVSLSLDQVIDGWKEGIPGMKVGGTRRLYIPAAQAYGSQSAGSIPANSDLVFDVTLQAIGNNEQ